MNAVYQTHKGCTDEGELLLGSSVGVELSDVLFRRPGMRIGAALQNWAP